MSDESENKEEVNSKEEPQPKKKRINWKSILKIIKMVLMIIKKLKMLFFKIILLKNKK